MKIAVVGSRDFPDLALVREFVAGLPKDTVVVSGGAPGVDNEAEVVARAMGLRTEIFRAQWGKHGRKAGFLRNQDIVNAADRLVAFHHGKSKGTQHSIDLAQRAGKRVDIIYARFSA